MTSKNPNASCHSDPVPGDTAHKTQSSLAASAATEKSALDLSLFSLIEAVVDDANIERAWKNVKANKGAPGPDGITLDEFFETFRHHWPEVRQQFLEGTYRPGYWSNWRLPRTRLKKFKALGVPHDEAYPFAHSGKGRWCLSMTSGVQHALTNAWLQSQGLFTLEERWSALAPKRRTA